MITYPEPDPDLAPIARRNFIYEIKPEEAGERLDKFTSERSGLSRTKIRALIDFGSVWVDGKVCRRQSRPLTPGQGVTFQVPEYGPVRFYEIDPGRILYQDDWLLAYDKEAGIPCQQVPYDGYNNLFHALRRYRPDEYLALHHRLDSPTSGVMVFSRMKKANPGLSRLFASGNIVKNYLAVIQGSPVDDDFVVDRPIAKQKGRYYCPPDRVGKPALTDFQVLVRGDGRSLVKARPHTGRTHQIRLHLMEAGYPIVGDVSHHGSSAERLMLHAVSLEFEHPITRQRVIIEAPAPPAWFHPAGETGKNDEA